MSEPGIWHRSRDLPLDRASRIGVRELGVPKVCATCRDYESEMDSWKAAMIHGRCTRHDWSPHVAVRVGCNDWKPR